MKYKALPSLLVTLLLTLFTFASIGVHAKQEKDNKANKENEAIRSVVWHSVLANSEAEIRATTAVPSLTLSLRAKGNPAIAFRNKADLEQHLKAVKEERQKQGEPTEYAGPTDLGLPQPRISQVTITRASSTIAYMSHTLTYEPNTYKEPPLRLLAVLRKEQNTWKIVFHAVP